MGEEQDRERRAGGGLTSNNMIYSSVYIHNKWRAWVVVISRINGIEIDRGVDYGKCVRRPDPYRGLFVWNMPIWNYFLDPPTPIRYTPRMISFVVDSRSLAINLLFVYI